MYIYNMTRKTKKIVPKKNVVIVLDKFSGHLFHDIELYIVAFKKLNGKSCNIYFLKSKDYNKKTIHKHWNTILCSKLFNSDMKIIDNMDSLNPHIIIDRKTLDKKSINKAFATSIYHFPTKLWANCFPSSTIGKKIKILYAVRYNTSRSLDEKSYNELCSIIHKYDAFATICDMGKLTFEKQIETFRNHNVLIGCHGNNLSGIMWMNPESFVFEILPIKFKIKVYDYHCMSLCMKHNYTQIDCEAEELNSIYSLNKNNLTAMDSHLKMINDILS